MVLVTQNGQESAKQPTSTEVSRPYHNFLLSTQQKKDSVAKVVIPYTYYFYQVKSFPLLTLSCKLAIFLRYFGSLPFYNNIKIQ